MVDTTDWAELATTLYTSETVAEQLRTALNNPTLTIGQRLSNLPESLTEASPPARYIIPAGSSWASLARTLYNTSDEVEEQSRPPYSGTDAVIDFHYAEIDAPSQLTSTSGDLTRNYRYDANGNILSDGVKTLTYNAHNKVATLTRNTTTHTRFEYGPDRKRYLRVDQRESETTETLYVGEGYERVITQSDSTTVQHKYHVHGIAIITQTERASSLNNESETTHSMITDYQDTVLGIADSSGALIQRFRYTPYGEQVEVSQGITGNQYFTTKGYTSHEHIEGMDIIHMNGRIYDPVIGRMMQSDPIIQAPEFVLSYNRYAYVWNNPMNRIDPTGYISSDGDGPEGHDAGDDALTDEFNAAYLSEKDVSVNGKSHTDRNSNPDQLVNPDKDIQPEKDEQAVKDKAKESKGRTKGGRSEKANKGKSIDPDKQRDVTNTVISIASIFFGILSLTPCSGLCGAISFALTATVAVDQAKAGELTDAALSLAPYGVGKGLGKIGSNLDDEFGHVLGTMSEAGIATGLTGYGATVNTDR